MDDNKIEITVELDSKKAEQQAEKLNDKLVDGAKDANREFKKYTNDTNNNLNKIKQQMDKTFDGVRLSNKMTQGLSTALGKIKTQINNVLGNININAKANIKTTTSSDNSNNNGGQGVSSMGASLVTGGAIGASLSKALSIGRDFKKEILNISDVLKNIDKLKIGDDLFDLDNITEGIYEIQDFFNTSFSEAVDLLNGQLREAQAELQRTTVDVASLEYSLETVKAVLDMMNLGEKSIVKKDDIDSFKRLRQVIEETNQALIKHRQNSSSLKPVNPEAYQEFSKLTTALVNATQGARKFQLVFNNVMTTVSDAVYRANEAISNKLPSGISKAFNSVRKFGNTMKQSFMEGFKNPQQYIDSMKNKIIDWSNKHKQATDKVKNANKSTGTSFKSLLQQVLPFASLYGIFQGLKTSITSYTDSMETLSKFQTVFGSMSDEATKWADTLSSSVAVNKTALMDTSSSIMAIAKSMGMATPEAYKMSTAMSELAIDMDSFYNRTDSLDKIRSALTGEYEPLKQMGIVLSEDAVKAKALAMGLDSASNSSKMLARQALITDQMLASGAMGDATRTAMSLSSQLKMLQYNFQALGQAIGSCFGGLLQVVLPVLNRIVQAVTTAFNKLASLINGIFGVFGIKVGGASGGTSGGVGGIGGAISDAVGGIGDALGGGLDDASGGASKVADSLADGAKSAKEIAKGLMGIDQINNLSKPSDSGGSGSGGRGGSGGSGGSGGGSGSGIGDGGIGGFDTTGFDSTSSEIETKISELARKIGNALKAIWGALSDGWNSVSGYIKQSIENLKTAFSNLGTAISNFLISCWNNGGEELIYNFGRLAGAITGAMLDIASQTINAVANLFAYLNPDTNPYTKAFINGLNNLLVACQNFALSVGGWFRTFLDNGGQAFLNVMGDICMIIGTTLANVLATAIDWITKFMNSWVGTTLIKACALALDILAGAVKAVAIVVEKLTPVWSALLLAWGAYSTYKTVTTLLGKMGKALVDVGLAIASNLEATLVWVKNGLTKLVSVLGKAISSTVKFASSMVKNVVSAIWSASGSMSAYILSLFGVTTAEGAATVGATALQVALSALGIGLVIAAIAGLIAIIKNWSTISKKMSELWSKFMDYLGEKCPWLQAIFQGLGNIFSWIGEKLGWLWGKVKDFFGWSGDNEPLEMAEDTSDSMIELGDTIEQTSDRFGTATSSINQSLASIHVDSNKLALSLDEAEATFNEKFGMMSKNAQDYLDALATGNQDVLQRMSADSATYTEEIRYSYEKMTDEEKALFYATYGEIEGITDGWMNYTGLTYDQMALRHASYVENILGNEKLSAQEKDRLIEEANTNFKTSLDTQLADLKSQLAEIDSMEGLSNSERIAMKQDLKDQIQALEQGMTNDSITSINSVEDAVKQSTDTQSQAYDGVSSSQQEALKGVDTSLEETKDNLKSFKDESDKVASEIPKAWSGIGKTISTEFNLAKQEVIKAFNDMNASIKNQSTVLKTSLANAFKGITTDAKTNTANMAKSVTNAFKSMANSIKQELNSLSNTIKNSFQTIGNNINTSFSNISSKLTSTLNTMKTQANNALNSIKNTFSTSLDSIKTNSQNKMTQICSGMVQKLNQSKNDITNAFRGIGNSINGSLDSLNYQIRNKMNNIVSTIQYGVQRMKNATNFSFPIPYMRMPHIQVHGSWNFEKKTVPSFSVKWYSGGAIFSKPTILSGIGVGDASSGMGSQMEAVLPLNKLWDELGKQFDKQNKALANNKQGDIHITLEMDGKQVAKGVYKQQKQMTQLGEIDWSFL